MSTKKVKKTKTRPTKLEKRFNFLRGVAKSLFKVFFPCEIHGCIKNADGPLILIGNHYSYLDVVYPVMAFDGAIHFVAKRELWEGGAAMKRFVVRMEAIPVNRDGNDVQAIKDCLRILKNDGTLCIFPEGTRNKSYDDILPFKSGAALLSIKTQTPIIPIVKVTKSKLFRKTHVIIGDPIEFRQFYGKKVSKEEIDGCDETLRTAVKNMRLAFLSTHKVKIKNGKL